MKKFLGFTILFVGMQASALLSASPTQTAFQGLYLGGNIGYGEGGGEKHFIEAPNSLQNKNKLGVRGIDGGVGTGYIHRIQKWAVGLSFDVNWTNSQGYHNHLDGAEKVKAQLNNSLQLYARTGYVFYENIMPFIGLGWDNSAWTLSSTHTNSLNIVNHDSTSHRQNAFLWKAGIDFLIRDYLVFGFEYTGTLASALNYAYANEVALDSWLPQYNKIAFTAKVIPFASSTKTAYALGNKTSQPYPSGFYLGGNIGYGNGIGTKKKFKQTAEDRISIPNVRGVDGGIGVGYLYPFGAWRAGLSFDANWSSASGRRLNVPENRNSSVRLQNSLQLYARAGYAFWESIMPFVGLGWDNSAWQLVFSAPEAVDTMSHRQNALLWKLGVDFAMSKDIVCGFEYIGTVANPQLYTYNPPFIDHPSNTLTSFSHSWKPQYNKYAMTLKFFF